MWRKNNSERKQDGIYQKTSATKMLVKKFVKIVSLIVGISLIILFAASYGYITHANNVFQDHLARAQAAELEELEQLRGAAAGDDVTTLETGEHAEIVDEPIESARHTTFMILGLDEVANLPDVIIVGVFNHETQDISLISVPRDTRVELSGATVREMQALGGFPPSSGVTRINAVHTHGRAQGPRFVQQELESLLGFKIDYSVVMSLAAFRAIVDAVGGVTMDIPRALFYDPYDQSLVINIPAGRQHLDGRMAEGLVRYRATYGRGDMQRIDVQHEFMRQLFSQVLQRENIMGNAFEYARIVIEYVNTDFGVLDIPQYLRYITRISADNLSTYTLPGTPARFFNHDPLETRMLVAGIFWEGERDDDGRPVIQQEDIRVAVLNGGAVSGLAGQRRDMLINNGFVRVIADDFNGTRVDHTRIISHNETAAQLVAEYFPGAVIESATTQNLALLGNHDVVVVIGLRER